MPRLTTWTTGALTILLLLAAGAQAAEHTRMDLEALAWEPGISGTIQVLEDEFASEVDFEGDLGLEGDLVTDIRLSFYPSRRTRLRLSRVPIAYSGDRIVSRTISFAGELFTIRTRVASQFEMNYVRAAFAWQFLESGDERFRIGPILEAKGFEGSASLGAPDFGSLLTVTEDFEAAFGSVGLIFDLDFSHRVQAFGEYGILVGTDEGDQTEFEVGVRVLLWEALNAVVGYRSIQFDFEDERDIVDLEMEGAFLGLSLRF